MTHRLLRHCSSHRRRSSPLLLVHGSSSPCQSLFFLTILCPSRRPNLTGATSSLFIAPSPSHRRVSLCSARNCRQQLTAAHLISHRVEPSHAANAVEYLEPRRSKPSLLSSSSISAQSDLPRSRHDQGSPPSLLPCSRRVAQPLLHLCRVVSCRRPKLSPSPSKSSHGVLRVSLKLMVSLSLIEFEN